MKRFFSKKRVLFAGCIFGVAAGFACVAIAQEPADVSRLLSDAKLQAYQISVHAETLDSYMRQPSLSWTSHAMEVERMKNDINAAAKTVGKMNDARSGASSWQKTAIDRIIPMMQEIADNTTRTIEFLNNNQKPAQPLTAGEYREYVEANADLSRDLADMIGKFVDYGNTRSRYEKLRKSLELRNR